MILIPHFLRACSLTFLFAALSIIFSFISYAVFLVASYGTLLYSVDTVVKTSHTLLMVVDSLGNLIFMMV